MSSARWQLTGGFPRFSAEDSAYAEEMGPQGVPDTPHKPFPPRYFRIPPHAISEGVASQGFPGTTLRTGTGRARPGTDPGRHGAAPGPAAGQPGRKRGKREDQGKREDYGNAGTKGNA